MKFDEAWNAGFGLLLRLGALALGGWLAYCEVTGTRDYYLALEDGQWTWIVKAMVGVTLATAIVPSAITMSFRARQYILGLGMLIALPAAMLIVFAAALSRTGASTDIQEKTVSQATRNSDLDVAAEKEARDALKTAKEAIKAECDDGRGTNCRKMEAALPAAQQRWDDAVKALKGEKVVIADPWFKRAAALSGGRVTVEQMQTYWPAVTPLIVTVFAGLLIAFGAHFKSPRQASPEVAPKLAPITAPRERMDWRLTWGGQKGGLAPQRIPPPTASEPIPLEVVDAEIIEPERKPSPFRRRAPGLKLVASNADMSALAIVDFIVETMESCPGGRVAEPDVYKAYMRNCKAASAKPLSAAEFVPVLDKVCTDLGIRREQKANRVYLMDVQLVRAALAS